MTSEVAKNKSTPEYREKERLRYAREAERRSKYKREYYEQNREKILNKVKERNYEKVGGKRPRGRPRKYPDDTPQPNTAD